MNKNIYNFVNYRYMSFTFSDLIFRILGILLYNVVIVYLVMILSPVISPFSDFSLDDLFTIDEQKLPFIFVALNLTVVLSILISILYSKKTKWSVIFIRGLTYSYISISLLICSCILDFRGIFTFKQIIIIVIKLFIYFLCTQLYTFYLHKRKLKKFDANKQYEPSIYAVLLAGSLGVSINRLLSA